MYRDIVLYHDTQYCDTDTGIYVYHTSLKNITHMRSTLAVRL